MKKLLLALMTMMPLAAVATEAHRHWHSVPEPGTLALLLLGGVGLLWNRKG